MATEGVVIRVVCLQVCLCHVSLMPWVAQYVNEVIINWKREADLFHRVTKQRRRTNTFKKCQHTALLFETDSSQCQRVPQSRFAHATAVLQKQLHVPWWFITSNTFWQLLLHVFFSCWNMTKGYKTLEVKLKNGYSLAILWYAQLHPPSQGHILTAFPCGPFLACRGRLSKWCSTLCLSRLLLFRVGSVTLQWHSSTLWSFLLSTHIPQHASFFMSQYFFFLFFLTPHCLLSISQAKKSVRWFEEKKARIVSLCLFSFLI